MTRITPREWENLSAYLDQQLSEKERTRLESRLQGNPELRTALEELRRTRLILRSQPRLRAPRNFTLTAEMLANPSASAKSAKRTAVQLMPRAFPALRFASALASILLVLVVLGDVLSGAPAIPATNRAAAPAAIEQAAPPEVMMQKSAPTEAAAAVASGAFLAPTEQPAPEGTTVAGGAARTMLAVTPTPMATAAPPSLAMESVPATSGPEATSVSLMTGPAEGDTAAQPEAALQAPSAQDAQPVGNLVRGPERLLNLTTLRMLELSLALLAVGTGLLAVYIRRTN